MQTTKIRNAFANNMSTDIKLSEAQTNNAIPLARDNLPGLVSNLTSNAISKFERKISVKGAGKGFTLFISNEDMNDIIKMIK